MATTADTEAVAPPAFRALAFGPHLAPGGQQVAVRMGAEGLYFAASAGEELCAPYSGLLVSRGGFDHQQLILGWHTHGGPWSLVVEDAHAREVLAAHAPEGLAQRLAVWRRGVRRTRRRGRAGWAVLGLTLLAPVLLALIFWWQSDRIAGWIADGVSPETERELGQLLWAETRPTLTLIDQGEASRAVREIGQRLTQGLPQHFEWHVVKSAAINAYAMPGGHVVVYTGLIRAADTPEELAGVLAHEVEHVMQRHSLKGLVKQSGWRAIMALALGGWGGGVWGDMAAQLGTLKFSRDMETEADIKALDLLKRAGIKPEGMVAFFEKLAHQDAAQIAVLSTHPASAQRMAALRSAIMRSGGWVSQPLRYDWPAVKASIGSG